MIQFKVENNPISMTVERVAVVGEGAYERGYDKGYADGETVGYTKGNSDGYTNGYETGYAEGKGEIYFTPNGVGYFENTILDCKRITSGAWLGADNLKVLELTEWNPTSTTDLKVVNNVSLSDTFQSASLETLLLPKLQYSGHYWIRNAKGLKTVQLGSIGYPINSLGDYAFWNCTQNDLTITVYVADDATLPVSKSPWGATNATIIYRSATTGEVIEV